MVILKMIEVAFTDINNDKTRNGKISEGDTYNLLFKYIIRNAVCTLPECPKKEDYRIYIDDVDERCYCEIPG